MSELDLDHEVWAFALALYARPGVADACLVLQAQASADVPLVLFALFALTARGVALQADDIAEARRRTRAWQEQVVSPLRGVRTDLKTERHRSLAPVLDLRAQVKQLELRAERIELAILAAWFEERSFPAVPGTPEALLRRLLDQFAETGTDPSDVAAVEEAIELLAR